MPALISIIAPMFDEIEHVDGFVEDIAAQDYSGEIEILVADGRSTDGCRERLLDLARHHSLDLTVLDNPQRIVAPGLNACIRRARGELIVRLDLHSRYPTDYVRRCVEVADATGAWNVGGIYEPRGRTRLERAVACALTSPFGGVNWTRASATRSEADTVYLGAFRPEAFEKAGLYDESLVRNQDDELNLRIRRAGGRIVLDPLIRSVYTPRGSFRAVWRQYWEYGYWKVIVMRKHRQLPGARALTPAAFVGLVGTLAALAVVVSSARWLLVVVLGAYLGAATVSAIVATKQRAEPTGLVIRVIPAFACFHLGYGVGMWRAALDLARRGGRARSSTPEGTTGGSRLT